MHQLTHTHTDTHTHTCTHIHTHIRTHTHTHVQVAVEKDDALDAGDLVVFVEPEEAASVQV